VHESDIHRIDVARVVAETIKRFDLIRSGERVVVGFSGGPDSLVLLHVLMSLREELGFELHAAHLNHMLRGAEADADASFARRICSEWDVPLAVERRDVSKVAADRGLAIEEAARQVRYGFLARVAEEKDAGVVAVAHNADDQVETVLMHFIRGSGLAGLRGMLPSVRLADLHIVDDEPVRSDVRLVRPLLEVPRWAIEEYCAEKDLRPRFDRSNLDTTYFRNRMRHELIPHLESFNPGIREVVRRAARLFAADYEYLVAARDQAWERVVILADESRIVFDLGAFRGLHASLQRALVRKAIAALRTSLRNINWVHVEQAVECLRNTVGAGPKVTLPSGLMMTIGYDRFAIGEEALANVFDDSYPQMPPGVREMAVPVPGTIAMGEAWTLSTELMQRQVLSEDVLKGEHPWTAYLDADRIGRHLVVRGRRPGDRMRPLGLEGHSKKIGELMINLKIPAASRDRYPLLVSEVAVLWLPGFHIAHDARVTASTRQVLAARVEKKR